MGTLAKLIKFDINYYIKPRFTDKKERNKFILILLIMGICFIVPIIMMIGAVYMGTGIAVENGILPELLSMLFFAVQIMLIVLGLTNYINMVYFSKDNTLLASMPIKSTHIYISKMIVCLISMIMLSSIITIPAIITIAVAMHSAGVPIGAMYYIGGLFSVIYVPLLPLLVVSILAFPIMKVIVMLKKKPVFMSIVYASFALIVIAITWVMMFSLEANDGGIGIEILIKEMSKIGKFSYATLVIARIMIGVNIGANIGILAGIVIGLVAIDILLSALLYRKTVANIGEGGFDKTKTKGTAETKSKPTRLALLLREAKMMLRSPDLMVQTIMMVVMSPLVIIIFSRFQNDMPTEGNPKLFLTAMTYFYMSIFGGMNYLSAIGISREGGQLSILKSLPISNDEIVSTKLLLADIVTIVTAVLSGIAYAFSVTGVPWFFSILLIISGSIMGISLNAYSLYRDVKKPNLKWMNIKDITKKNFGAIIPMFISMAQGMIITIITGGISYAPIGYGGQYAIFWTIVFAINILYYLIFRMGKKTKMVVAFDEIEM